ncbi:hypothetical protein VTO42DRAFT_5078 [Malbranchea cinnamomea]
MAAWLFPLQRIAVSCRGCVRMRSDPRSLPLVVTPVLGRRRSLAIGFPREATLDSSRSLSHRRARFTTTVAGMVLWEVCLVPCSNRHSGNRQSCSHLSRQPPFFILERTTTTPGRELEDRQRLECRTFNPLAFGRPGSNVKFKGCRRPLAHRPHIGRWVVDVRATAEWSSGPA